ncbi:type IV pilus biogenesis protein PilP [Pseudomonas sp. Os17]|uniref:pilus assembly protein PilP n=1 Tax=Pseudomonas TaxID=286 RepID=UPI0005FC6DA2|nr:MULTISPECIES: pilus assembly protein PilP [Pseudomonas]RXU64727.1 pilus assembly protein PilP [Pseudomonas protegens]BAQ72133.1 type IV pilus biogenesis protein PilP [Pseudomonas sp. Os17]
MKAWCWLMWACFGLGLCGCEGAADFAETQAFMKQMRRQAPEPIEPLPVVRSSPAFTYDASGLRSPFQPPQSVERVERRWSEQAVRPDPQRPRQYLEGFDIERLQMVGTMSGTSASFALLRSAEGVHRLQIGDYLGRSEGRIVAISESRVEVLEIVADGAGGWQERPRTLLLKKHSQVESAQ